MLKLGGVLMGKKKRHTDEEERFVECEVCEEEIAIEYYMDRGDLITCEECGSDYILKSRNPMILSLQEDDEEYEDDYYDEDDYFIQGYD